MAKKHTPKVHHKKRKARGPLEADTSGSECFSSLTWEDGVVYAEFVKGGSDEIPMSRKAAKEFFAEADGGGLGEYYNDELKG